ncbi:MAG: hypothetical protein WCI72_05400 [archaeon]
MLKRVLPFIVGIFITGSVFSEDLFSWYLQSDTNVKWMNFSPSLGFYESIDFGEKKESFVNNYTRLLGDRIGGSRIAVHRDISRDDKFNYERSMTHTLTTTVIERYELAAEVKRIAELVKDKVTVERPVTSSLSPKRSLKIAVRPSVKGANFTGIGAEVTLRNAERDSIASVRIYSEYAELKVPLGNFFDRRDELEISLGEPKPHVSLGARVRYDGTSNTFIGYEIPLK